MQFRTTFSIPPQEPKIDHYSEVFLLGSCFVENIGEKLDYYKLPNLRNPFGILYHPAALENFIDKAVKNLGYSAEDVIQHNERWHSFEAHSIMSNIDREELVKNLNINLTFTREYLEKASHVILTLGTSIGYILQETGYYVANCHKFPQHRFHKNMMEIADIIVCLQNIISALQSINPGIAIIFTISPVRHIKDGVVQNQVSKSRLIEAVSKIVEKFAEVSYFPAYEIVMDELRDYRFYSEDMLHPNSTAIEYIWQKFTETWMSKESIPVLKEIGSIQRGLNHRSFNSESEAHQKFLVGLQASIEKLRNKFPHLNF
ncbi:GSCFA domain-containing protein [Antarcticibacterium sp. 1MA-6-2]|uniref:GSCFA domain-containing protein n=1 Tax=Antarcticibacterium sp. 1MA-6-2 TaxID=2908210 RepID=UPI001F3BC5F0|nr:GSCFA domain-containing protein [Antarcticibacterium sp. 1MA-6-2]UJH92297.1 GSCFA domain-containing protein [Antarcticibacterium sp. 1MA-6-2]